MKSLNRKWRIFNMITNQSKKFKRNLAVTATGKKPVLDYPKVMKKSIIYHSEHWRYFFTRKKQLKLFGNGWYYKYKVKKGKKDLVNRAMFMHKKGYYPGQKAEIT